MLLFSTKRQNTAATVSVYVHGKFKRTQLWGWVLLGLLGTACNSSDSQRFTEQEQLTSSASSFLKFTAAGATSFEANPTENFRCPYLSGLSADKDISTFYMNTNSITPHFSLETQLGVQCEETSALGVSLYHFPLELVDIFQMCNANANEMYTTYCPTGDGKEDYRWESFYRLVDSCDEVDPKDKYACAKIHDGKYQLVAQSQYLDDENCYKAESYNRPLPQTNIAANACYNCDAFEPIPIVAALRGTQPAAAGCCSLEKQAHVDFCFRPCGCRKTSIKLIPKQTQNNTTQSLKLAVFSDVQGNTETLEKILQNAKKLEVDAFLNIGNLTDSGDPSEVEKITSLLEKYLKTLDGDQCTNKQNSLCCDNTKPEQTRNFTQLCNVELHRNPFLTGIGNYETEKDRFKAFYQTFNTTNFTTTIGKVQLILLDTANGTFSAQQQKWLEDILASPQQKNCQIPSPPGSEWPLLIECLNAGANSCSHCIGTEALCVPPNNLRANTAYGATNCMCIPKNADYCHNNQVCSKEDNSTAKCLCESDEDCGIGGFCQEDGSCKPPLRLVFSHTPLFDNSGTRNNAFASRQEAAKLFATLQSANTTHIFSGNITDYASFKMGNILYTITGGGGAPMEALTNAKNHWLLVTIPNAWDNPKPEDITVEIQNL